MMDNGHQMHSINSELWFTSIDLNQLVHLDVLLREQNVTRPPHISELHNLQ